MINGEPDEGLFSILKRLAEEGYLRNNHKLDMEGTDTDINSRIVELICSMGNLQTLDLPNYELSSQDLSDILQSCSEITHLRIKADNDEMFNMDETIKDQLKPGFQKLRFFQIKCYIDSDTILVLQEMLT
jgi:RNA recognition motif-containing protein